MAEKKDNREKKATVKFDKKTYDKELKQLLKDYKKKKDTSLMMN